MAPHATTEQTPASMLLGHPVRTRLALVTSDVRQTVDDRTLVNATQRFCEFRNGESVWVRNYRSTIPWIRGWILERSGPLSYTVAIGGNVIWKRHVSQIRAAEEDDDTAAEENHTSTSKGNSRPLTHESREQHTEQQTAQQPPPRPRAEEEAEIGTPVRNRTNSPESQEQGERATPREEDTSRVRPTTPSPTPVGPQSATTPRPEPVSVAAHLNQRQRPRWHSEYEVEYC